MAAGSIQGRISKNPLLLCVNLYISDANENPCKQGLEHCVGLVAVVAAACFKGKLAFKEWQSL